MLSLAEFPYFPSNNKGPAEAAMRMRRMHVIREAARAVGQRHAHGLDQLEKQANKLGMPVTYASMMYLLRPHIAVVRDRLKAR